ncbi:hypothetical protein DNTS_034957 [Danionella cerebrum]|uniref:Coiled-coil domain-containing protein 40 n=1 Tax=Danionella cerebrum TaxID=2873325 RepID=A0A553MT43_9TELE|nr:hypothetical protein DNTS_034957 [Danionella translucida]
MEGQNHDDRDTDYAITEGSFHTEGPEINSERTQAMPPHSLQMEITGETEADESIRVEDEEEEVVVLDPEHPLMKRFQSALKRNLSYQLERINLELSEKTATEKTEATRRHVLAEEVYMVHEMLARLQMSLESNHEANAEAAARGRQAQDQLDEVKKQYQETARQTKTQHSQVTELQSKVDSLALKLLYMQESNSSLRSDIKAIINAANKTQKERTQAEEHKQQQDLYVERLTLHVEKLNEQISLFEFQITAQTKQTTAAKEALSEAQLELDSVIVERKQLLQQWNSSLLMMKKRDETFTGTQEELRLAEKQLISLDTEIDSYKKSILKEEEQNERLTLCLNRAQADCTASRKLITQSQNQQEALHTQYTTYTRVLQETEKSLRMLQEDYEQRQSELKAVRKLMEKESGMRLDLEEQIMKKLQEQLTHSNAAKYSQRLTDKTAAHRREKEAQLIKMENEINAATLEEQELAIRLDSLRAFQAELEQKMNQQHLLMSCREAEIAKQGKDIERKQATITFYNKKIKDIISTTGHEDLGPLEIRVGTLSKELEEVSAEIKELQHLWLWQQGELVRFTQEKQAHSSSVQALQTQLTILQQSKIRREGVMEQDQREQADLEKQTKVLMADMLKLNALLSKNSDLNQALQESNSLMETEFRQKLKQRRQIMLWEKKTQLMRETRSAIDSNVGKGEMQTMKAEIHRMEVRYTQLMKQQERLLRDMESVIARRETIAVRSEAQARSQHKSPTQTEYHNTLQSLRRRILQTKKQAEESDAVMSELKERQSSITTRLQENQDRFSELQRTKAALTQDYSRLQETKERNMYHLPRLQARAKHLLAIKEGRYTPVTSGDSALELATQKQQERLKMISSVLQSLVQEYPQHHRTLHRISITLGDLQNSQ